MSSPSSPSDSSYRVDPEAPTQAGFFGDTQAFDPEGPTQIQNYQGMDVDPDAPTQVNHGE